MRWVRHVARMGERRRTLVLVWKPGRKKPLERWSCRRVDNIKMDLGEIGWGGVDWIGLAQDRDKWRALMNVVLNLQVPSDSGKLLSDCTTGGPLSGTQLHSVSQFCSWSSASCKYGLYCWHLRYTACCIDLQRQSQQSGWTFMYIIGTCFNRPIEKRWN
jgi:hypothetical protein